MTATNKQIAELRSDFDLDDVDENDEDSHHDRVVIRAWLAEVLEPVKYEFLSYTGRWCECDKQDFDLDFIKSGETKSRTLYAYA